MSSGISSRLRSYYEKIELGLREDECGRRRQSVDRVLSRGTGHTVLRCSCSHLRHVSYVSLIIQPEPKHNEIHTIIDLLDIRTEGRVLVMNLQRLPYVLGPRKSCLSEL